LNIGELDFLVFEHVFENEKGYVDWLKEDYLKDKDANTFFANPVSRFSTDMTDAWKVVKKMNERGYYFSLEQDSDLGFDVCFTDAFYNDDITKKAVYTHVNAEKAICLAALKILNVEVTQ